MKNRLLPLLRLFSYFAALVVAGLGVLHLGQGWITKPLPLDGFKHVGVPLADFQLTFMPGLTGVAFKGTPNNSLWFSSLTGTLLAGEEGTPESILVLLRWRSAVISLLLLIWAALLFLLGRLFAVIQKGEIYTLRGVRQFRLIGWVCLTGFAISTVFWNVFARVIAGKLPFQNLADHGQVIINGQPTGILMGPPPLSLDSITAVYFGLFSLVLAEVIRQGLLIKQENDLTV